MSRPLTKYNEIKARAEMTYKARIQALERDLAVSAAKVRRIRGSVNAGSGNLSLTDEQRRDLGEYMTEISQGKRELRSIVRSLKKDMNKIDTLLRIINMLAVPLFVALAGLVWAFARFSTWRHGK